MVIETVLLSPIGIAHIRGSIEEVVVPQIQLGSTETEVTIVC